MVLLSGELPRAYRTLAAPWDCSSSRPSSRWLVARRRCDSMSTSSIRILAPSSGCSTMMRARFSRSSTAISVGAAARQVAKRGSPSIIDISPSVRPASTEARSCGVFQRSRLCTSTVPSSTISMKSPPSPSRMISAPGSARYTAMKWASSCTSAGEKFSSSVHLGISVSIRAANCVASPRYSRWASCCGHSGMTGFAPDYAETLPLALAPCPHCFGKALEQLDRIVPAEAGVGDALSEGERLAGLEVLAPFDQVRLHHDADDAPLAGGDLAADLGGDLGLAAVVLGGVGVRAVDHQPLGEPGAGELLAGRLHAGCIVVRRLAAAQDDVAVVVAPGLHDRDLPAFVHREEVVLLARGEQCIDRDFDVAVGAVLEPHRCGEAGGKLAVHLAFGGARADRPPGHQVADVLRRDHIEELAARRHARLVDAHEKVARDAQALVDAEAAVEIGVVDQAFPAHRGARLLEIDPHEDFELARMLFPFLGKLLGIGESGHWVMDGARPDHHQHAIGAAVQNLAQLGPRVGDLRFHCAALDREKADQVLRRRQRNDVVDALVVGE